jgi:hypothetical protein
MAGQDAPEQVADPTGVVATDPRRTTPCAARSKGTLQVVDDKLTFLFLTRF